MKTKWLPESVAVMLMMILFVGCGNTVDSTGISVQSDSGEIQNDGGAPKAENVEVQNTISVNKTESEERTLLYRVLLHYPGDTDPEDDEVVYEYTYDESGRLLSEKEYENNNIIFDYKYEYNEVGELIKRTRYFKGDLDYWSEYEYDASGYLVRENNYGSEGDIGSYTDYENDSSGNVVKEVSCLMDGSIIKSVEYMYDVSGKLIEETCYKETFHDNYETRIEYVYDASGNLLKEINYTNGRFFHYNEYLYDSDGKLTRKENHIISSLNGEDTLNNYLEYTYDESGALLTSVMYDRDENVYYDTEREKFVECYRYEYITVGARG